MKIAESFLTQNPCYKTARKIKVTGLMLHSVGCAQPSAKEFIKNWNSSNFKRACVHAFIDAGTGVIYQTLPWNYRGWHCGGAGNDTHIGVEMCEPDCIKYGGGASFRCTNQERAKAMVKRTYDSAVELFAYLCKIYELNPLEDGVIISHKEGHGREIASGHVDPEHLWEGLGTGYTMDGFRRAVSEAMKQSAS
ncbi:MAG: N-acetylmuramoyl-L-alanine amidase [Lachnospiraceae bacterium]|nr:N-acetylmuramoyl-L-alanine amidase [Lachnospiraceae bacterium]